MALSDNQVSYWKLDESSGNAADSAGSITLTNNNSVSFVSGKINNGADFGSSNTNKTFTGNSALTRAQIKAGYTVSAWVKFSTVNNGRGIVGMVRSDGDYANFELRYTTGFQLRVYANPDNIVGTTSATTGVWYHVVGTYDGSTLKLYVNGSLEASKSYSYATLGDSGQNQTVIGSGLGGEYTSAIIDEVGVWSRALSDSEVTELYNSGNGNQYPYSLSVTVNATVVASTFSQPATTVTAIRNATISAGVQSATFSAPARTVTGTANVTASTPSATFSIPAVNIITPDAQVNVGVLSATFSIPAMTVRISNTVSQGTPPSATFSIPASSVKIDFTHASNALSATFTVPTPTISAESNITVSPSALSATFSLPAVTVSGEQNAMFEAGVLSATFSVQAPTVTAIRNITVDASVLSALFSVQTPRKVGGLWTAQPRNEGVWTAQGRVI